VSIILKKLFKGVGKEMQNTTSALAIYKDAVVLGAEISD
jgi:hypothetical protein